MLDSSPVVSFAFPVVDEPPQVPAVTSTVSYLAAATSGDVGNGVGALRALELELKQDGEPEEATLSVNVTLSDDSCVVGNGDYVNVVALANEAAGDVESGEVVTLAFGYCGYGVPLRALLG